MATTPEAEGMDSSFGARTGWDRKEIKQIRETRWASTNRKNCKSILKKIRKRRRDALPIRDKIFARDFWNKRSHAANLGAGKYAKVSWMSELIFCIF